MVESTGTNSLADRHEYWASGMSAVIYYRDNQRSRPREHVRCLLSVVRSIRRSDHPPAEKNPANHHAPTIATMPFSERLAPVALDNVFRLCPWDGISRT
jgi:hypothetical protein